LALGERAEALPQLEEALTIARRLDMRQLTAWLLHNVAFASAAGGDFAQARSYDGEALAIYRELGATGSAARIIAFDLSVFEFWAGNTGAAIARAGEALAMFRAIDDAEGTAMTLTNMAAWLVSLDRYDEAEVNAREALELARTHPDGDVVWPLQELGDISALRPRATKEDAYAACVRSARLMGFVDVRMNARGVVRWVTGQREYDRVITVLREVLGAEGLADRLAAGALMSEDEAIEEALRA
jgi:tetratricopeptide (TPR) repeat protein